MLRKLTKSSLALNALGRCLTNHLSSIKVLTRGVVSVEQGNDPGNNEVYDVIISGGGMVGSAMACSLGEYVFLNQMTRFSRVIYSVY